jgi:hypothetical protein
VLRKAGEKGRRPFRFSASGGMRDAEARLASLNIAMKTIPQVSRDFSAFDAPTQSAVFSDVAVDLQRRLVVQTPKSIVGYLFRRRAIAEQSHQNGDDPSIVLKKDDPEISLIPMLR